MKKGAKTELLARSWTVVASEYDKRLAPLFQPWISQLLKLFAAQNMPSGCILAPACGPGELCAARTSTLICIRPCPHFICDISHLVSRG